MSNKQDGTKRNHTASQGYLKAWSIPGKEKFVYNVVKKEFGWSKFSKPKHTNEICWWKDFYTLVSEHEIDRQTLEEEFQKKFENNWEDTIKELKNFPFAILIKPLEISKFDKLSQEAIDTLINFLHYQYKRSPRTKLKMMTNPEKFFSKTHYRKVKRILNEENEAHFWHKTFTNLQRISLQEDTGKIDNAIRGAYWVLIGNATNTPFVTSCNPVLWIDEVKYANKPCILAPLTPKLAIRVFPDIRSDKINYYNTTEQEVLSINKLTAHYSAHNVVSNDIVSLEYITKNVKYN